MSDIDRPPVSRPLLIALGAAALLAVLWLLVLSPMLAGDEDVVVPPPRARTTPEAPVPGQDGDTETLYPETTEVFAARDPFAQLVSNRPAGSSPILDDLQPGRSPAADPLPGESPGGGDGGSGGGGSSNGGGRPRNGSSAQVGGTRVKLVDVYDKDGEARALVTVNGRSYDVAEGEAFGDRFRLLDLSGECGTFLFGDSRFVLCEGDEIRK